jgi:hypothetical protein
MPVEVMEMLNGAIPSTPSMHCPRCNDFMPENNSDAPCDGCIHKVFIEACDRELMETMCHVPREMWDKAAWDSWDRTGQHMYWGGMEN